MNLSQETTRELLLAVLTKGEDRNVNTNSPFVVGNSYHIRTVTMAHAGIVKSVCDKFIVLEQASWVADTGRFNEYLKNTSKLRENEPFKNDVIVGIGAIIYATEIDCAYTDIK